MVGRRIKRFLCCSSTEPRDISDKQPYTRSKVTTSKEDTREETNPSILRVSIPSCSERQSAQTENTLESLKRTPPTAPLAENIPSKSLDEDLQKELDGKASSSGTGCAPPNCGQGLATPTEGSECSTPTEGSGDTTSNDESDEEMDVSQSTAARERGNSAYKSVNDGLSPVLKKERLNTALRHYNDANRLAETPNEKSSACKNIALATWKMASVIRARGESKDIVFFYYKEALKFFREAKTNADAQSLVWTQGVMTSAIVSYTESLEFLDGLSPDNRIPYLYSTVDLVMDTLTQGQAYLELTRNLFHAGVTELQQKNYKQSLSLLKDCYFPLNEARRLGGICVAHEAESLEGDIFIQMCVTESVQARVTGDELLAHVMREEEDLNMDMVWDVIDWYKTGIVLTREKDFEMEAIAHSRLGQVYDKVLHMKNRAKENFTRAVQLANLMKPRTFYSDGELSMITA